MSEVEGGADVLVGDDDPQLRAALTRWAGSAPEAERLVRTAGVDPAARGEALDIGDFARIAQARVTG